ncbi:MAG: hypothetical protein ACRC11_06855 [Xenococcaceae cyanobacterium]
MPSAAMPDAQCSDARCPLPNARCPMPIAQCPLPIAHYPLPDARCPLPIAYSLFPFPKISILSRSVNLQTSASVIGSVRLRFYDC